MNLWQKRMDNILLWNAGKIISWQDIQENRIQYIVVKQNGFMVYSKTDIMAHLLERKTQQLFLSELKAISPLPVVSGRLSLIEAKPQLENTAQVLILDENGQPGFILEAADLLIAAACVEEERDFSNKILNSMEEEIFVSNAAGQVIYMNPHSEKVCGFGKEQCVGYNVRELVKQGVFSESMTVEVLSGMEKVEKIVEVSTGRHIISTAIPVYDEDHILEYVLCTSKDIKEINDLMERNAVISRALDDSKREVADLQRRVIHQKNYVFESPSMREVKKTIMKIAPTDVTVLVEGETGTGKEITADLLHSLSKRSNQPFMKVNCGLIPVELLESELFGYMPGAFSGALKEGKIGIIEAANKGTIFLDEIGEMPLLLQVKLLEFLQDRKIMRIGGVKKISIDVRIIAATNRDLKEMVEKGEFRKDLYYRLNVMPIHLSPLRERREDIQPLAKLFLQKFNHEYHFNKKMNASVLFELVKHSWPGNVRELMHVIERFVVSSESDIIDERLLREVLGKPMQIRKIICTGIMPLNQAREELDDILVHTALERSGSTRKAAALLGVNQSTVVRILNKTKKFI